MAENGAGCEKINGEEDGMTDFCMMESRWLSVIWRGMRASVLA
jgi:hypothetical protein